MTHEYVQIRIRRYESVGEVLVGDLRLTLWRNEASVVETIEGRVAVYEEQHPGNQEKGTDEARVSREEANVE